MRNLRNQSAPNERHRNAAARSAAGALLLLSTWSVGLNATPTNAQMSTVPASKRATATAATHAGTLVGETLEWESRISFEVEDGTRRGTARLPLLRPLSPSVTIEGAILSSDRAALEIALKTRPVDPRRARRLLVTVHTREPKPESGAAIAFSPPLVGTPVERVSTDGFTLELDESLGVEARVGRNVAGSVSRKMRHKFERKTPGATPLGAIYLAPNASLRANGLVAKFHDVNQERKGAGRWFAGAGVVVAAGLTALFFALRQATQRERAQAILDADIEDLARYA